MTSRGLSRTDKPLAPIDNILNSDHVPVYKRVRFSSLRKRSVAAETKMQLYDFQVENGNEIRKRFKKSQKVRKRARIPLRQNKENVQKARDIARKEDKSDGKVVPVLKRDEAQKRVLGEITPEVVNQNCSGRTEKSVASRTCPNLNDDDEFFGFSEAPCSDRVQAFLREFEKIFLKDSEFASCSVGPKWTTDPDTRLISKPYATPNPYEACDKLTRLSNIPIIDFIESPEGNQLRPNGSSENINPNDTFHNVSYGQGDRFYSTPCKHNSFDSANLSDLSADDFNVTNCFGFEEPENMYEEFLVSPIKVNKKRLKVGVSAPTPSRPQLPSVRDIIDRLKGETEDVCNKAVIYAPEIEVSLIKSKNIAPYFNSSSLQYLSQEPIPEILMEDAEVHDVPTGTDNNVVAKQKPTRRSYERPLYLRQRRNSCHEESEPDEQAENLQNIKCNNKKSKTQKKKIGPSKKEVDELEKWAQAFNSQCAQVDAFDLCIE